MSTYIVQSIIDRRCDQKNQMEYLIKWKGYSLSDSTWQPIKNLVYVKQMVTDFDEKFDCQNQEKQKQKNSEANDDLKKQPLKAKQGKKLNRGRAKKCPSEKEDKPTKKQPKKQNILSNIKCNRNVLSEESKDQSIHAKYLATFYQQPQIQIQNTITSNMKIEENTDKTDKLTDEGNNQKENKIENPLIESVQHEKLQVLGMRKSESGECFFLVLSSTGLTSYKTREYLVKNYPENLIIFYESKMIFVEDKNLH